MAQWRKSLIADEIGNPMEVDDLTVGQVTDKTSPVLRAVSAERLVTARKAF
ncbi:MAG TPA: hypothetical protein VKB81_07915 [Nitrospira sp.]|nr:hypothetical protein [Nitrospira sp.]